MLVAAGMARFTTARTLTIKITLTSAGKRLLKRSRHLALTASATFTPPGQAAVRATVRFTLTP